MYLRIDIVITLSVNVCTISANSTDVYRGIYYDSSVDIDESVHTRCDCKTAQSMKSKRNIIEIYLFYNASVF